MAHRFKISKFLNRNGVTSYRVSGSLDGKQIRQNFKTRPEAVARRQELEIEWLNGSSQGQRVWTTLTHDQNRDAIAAVNILKQAGSSKSLTFAVNYLLEHYKEAEREKSIESAVNEYVDARSKDAMRGIISSRQEKSISMEMKNLKRAFAGRRVGELTADDLRTYLDTPLKRGSGVPSLKTWNNRRVYLSTFFKFCLAKKYVAEDPILEVPAYNLKKARGTAETFSAEQAAAFMAFLEPYRGGKGRKGWRGQVGCMVPYFALTLFAGIRPDWLHGEISKLRPEHIRLDTGVILIEPEVSKVNEKRTVKIQPNLHHWLEKYPLEQFPIIPPKMPYILEQLRREWKLPHDVMRHTFISMTVGAFRSVGDAALQAGNSEAIVKKHYLDLKSVEEADRFWRIVPEGVELGALEKREGGYVEILNPEILNLKKGVVG